MNNSVEHILEMKEITVDLQQFTAMSQRSFQQVERHAAKAAVQVNKLGASSELSTYSRQLAQTTKQLEQFSATQARVTMRSVTSRPAAPAATEAKPPQLLEDIKERFSPGSMMGYMQQASDNQRNARAMNTATGGHGAESMAFVQKESQRLGLSLDTATTQATSFFNAMQGGAVTLAQQQQLFTGISEASLAMGLSSEQQQNALTALTGIASQATVSADDLRGKLGDALPNAMSIAAKAMNMTSDQLAQGLDAGLIQTKDFLPLFASELHNTFGTQAQQVAGGFEANMNRVNNTVHQLRSGIGNALLPVTNVFLNNFLVPAATWLQENLDVIAPLVAMVGAGAVAYEAVSTVTQIWSQRQAILNTIMSVNPIGLVVAGVAALMVGVVTLYNKFDWFRGMVWGTWQALKSFVVLIKDMVIDRLKTLVSGVAGVGRALYQLFTGDFQDAFETGKQAIADLTGVSTAKKVIEDAGKMGRDVNEAYQEGLKAKPIGGITDPLAGAAGTASAHAPGPVAGVGMASVNTPMVAQQKTPGVNNGGPRNITLHISKLFDNIVVHTQTMEEGIDHLEDRITDALVRILSSGNLLVEK